MFQTFVIYTLLLASIVRTQKDRRTESGKRLQEFRVFRTGNLYEALNK
jgi:hypothetical protein